jgi:pilus assembly protein CpaF
MLRTSGRRIDMSTPSVDATMPDRSRLHVVIPDMILVSDLTSADGLS